MQHIHIDTVIAKAILKNGTRGSFHHWVQDDFDLTVTMPPKASRSRWFWFDSECPRSNFCQGIYGIPIPAIGRILTPRGTKTLTPESTSSRLRFLRSPHLLNLKTGHDVLINKHDCKVQEMYTVQDHPPPPNESLLLSPLDNLYKDHV